MKRFLKIMSLVLMFSIIGLSVLFVGCGTDTMGTITVQNNSSLTITKVTISGPTPFNDSVTLQKNGGSKDYKVEPGTYTVAVTVSSLLPVTIGTQSVVRGKTTNFILTD